MKETIVAPGTGTIAQESASQCRFVSGSQLIRDLVDAKWGL